MNSDYATILENAGADEFAAEGTQGHALYQLQRRIAELAAADVEYDNARAALDTHPTNISPEAWARYVTAKTRRAAAIDAVLGVQTIDERAKPLSVRVRPGVECAPWVLEEIRKLEQQCATLRGGAK